jgi:hypothetical protein
MSPLVILFHDVIPNVRLSFQKVGSNYECEYFFSFFFFLFLGSHGGRCGKRGNRLYTLTFSRINTCCNCPLLLVFHNLYKPLNPYKRIIQPMAINNYVVVLRFSNIDGLVAILH